MKRRKKTLDEKLVHATAMVNAWQTRAKRARTMLGKWRRRKAQYARFVALVCDRCGEAGATWVVRGEKLHPKCAAGHLNAKGV